MSRRKSPPRRNPAAAGSQGLRPCLRAISIEGARSDQKLAAIMTPAANPSRPSMTLCLIFLKKKTRDAPKAVAPQVKRVASKAWRKGDNPRSQSIMRGQCTKNDDCGPIPAGAPEPAEIRKKRDGNAACRLQRRTRNRQSGAPRLIVWTISTRTGRPATASKTSRTQPAEHRQ